MKRSGSADLPLHNGHVPKWDFVPNENFDALIEKERNESWKYGGKTVFGNAQPPKKSKGVQLRMF